jgi:hypothetical protein
MLSLLARALFKFSKVAGIARTGRLFYLLCEEKEKPKKVACLPC